MTWCAHGGISKTFFLGHVSPSFLGQKYFFVTFNFDLADQSWVCHILGVDALKALKENNLQEEIMSRYVRILYNLEVWW